MVDATQEHLALALSRIADLEAKLDNVASLVALAPFYYKFADRDVKIPLPSNVAFTSPMPTMLTCRSSPFLCSNIPFHVVLVLGDAQHPSHISVYLTMDRGTPVQSAAVRCMIELLDSDFQPLCSASLPAALLNVGLGYGWPEFCLFEPSKQIYCTNGKRVMFFRVKLFVRETNATKADQSKDLEDTSWTDASHFIP